MVPKQVKVVKEEPMDCSDAAGQAGSVDSSKRPAKAIVASPTEVKVQQTKIADLFTPKDVSS